MLELKNVSFEVESENNAHKEILKNINLTIDEHKFIALTGPNGGGKSTLAKIIVGIEKATSGQILFDGVDITNMSIPHLILLGRVYIPLMKRTENSLSSICQEKRSLTKQKVGGGHARTG